MEISRHLRGRAGGGAGGLEPARSHLDSLAEIDTATGAMSSIPVGAAPVDLACGGTRVYVANWNGTVSVGPGGNRTRSDIDRTKACASRCDPARWITRPTLVQRARERRGRGGTLLASRRR